MPRPDSASSRFTGGSRYKVPRLCLARYPGLVGVDNRVAKRFRIRYSRQSHRDLTVRKDLQIGRAIERIVAVRVEANVVDLGQGNFMRRLSLPTSLNHEPAVGKRVTARQTGKNLFEVERCQQQP